MAYYPNMMIMEVSNHMNNFDSVNSFHWKKSTPPHQKKLDKKRLLKHPFPARQFKSLLLILVLSAVFVPLLVSCPDAGSPTTYTVTFNSGEGSDVPSQNVNSGEKAVRPANPVRAEYNFINWYSDGTFQTVYDFNLPAEGDITLYAAWHHELKSVIDSGTVPADLSTYGSLVRAVLEPYTASAAIRAKYVDTTAQGSGDASSWANAAGDIKATLDGIADAGANTIYIVLLASGTHTPTDTLTMKNHVAHSRRMG